MRLPKRIQPCPIAEALVEIRFEPNLPEDAVFGIIFSRIKERFSEPESLPILDIPEKIRKSDTNLKYKPYHRLQNNNYVLQVGPRVLSLAVKKDYPGWDVLYDQFEWILKKTKPTQLINKIDRYSLRYINIFNDNIFENIDLEILLRGNSFHTDKTYLKTQIENETNRVILQISNNITYKEGREEKNGSLIDVDVTSSGPVENFLNKSRKLLDDIHVEEKKIFFSLLSEKFLTQLNPTYQ